MKIKRYSYFFEDICGISLQEKVFNPLYVSHQIIQHIQDNKKEIKLALDEGHKDILAILTALTVVKFRIIFFRKDEGKDGLIQKGGYNPENGVISIYVYPKIDSFFKRNGLDDFLLLFLDKLLEVLSHELIHRGQYFFANQNKIHQIFKKYKKNIINLEKLNDYLGTSEEIMAYAWSFYFLLRFREKLEDEEIKDKLNDFEYLKKFEYFKIYYDAFYENNKKLFNRFLKEVYQYTDNQAGFLTGNLIHKN